MYSFKVIKIAIINWNMCAIANLSNLIDNLR